MKPRLTLAVPTFNRAGYLRETLKCLLGQVYENFDIMVSDNGSSDETPKIISSFMASDRRVRGRRNESTVPSHVHFSQCLEAARGEYFILLCDDDWISSGFVSELVTIALQYTDVNVV